MGRGCILKRRKQRCAIRSNDQLRIYFMHFAIYSKSVSHQLRYMLQVSLFLSNLKGNMNNDVDLRAHMDTFGTVERCFVLRNPKGDSKVHREPSSLPCILSILFLPCGLCSSGQI